MAYEIPLIKNLESFRQQLNQIFVAIFADAHTWAAAQVFAANGLRVGTAQLVAAAGRVGVNELSPDYMLDVNGSFGITPGASVAPVDNGDVVFEFTNNTTLTFKGKGSDGTVRTATVTLA